MIDRKPLNMPGYTPESLVIDSIQIVTVANHIAATGKPAPPMQFFRDPKNWIDGKVLRNPSVYPRRITYPNVVELNDAGVVMWIKVADLPTPVTPQEVQAMEFYKEYRVLEIPSTTSMQISKDEAIQSNLAQTNEVIPPEWALRAPVPVPFSPLVAGEAWFPDPSGLLRARLQIVNIDLWRKQSPITKSGPAQSDITDLKALIKTGFDEIKKLLTK